MIFVLLITIFVFQIPVLGQVPNSDSTEKSQLLEVKTVKLSAEDIEARKKTALDSATLSGDMKIKIEENFSSAISNLKKANELNLKIQEFEKNMANTAEILEKMKKTTIQTNRDFKPSIPKDSSLAQLEQQLAQSQADLSSATGSLAEAETTLKSFSERRMEIPKLIVEAKKRFDAITQSLSTPAQATLDSMETAVSARTLLNSQKLLTESEIATLEKEQLSHDSRLEIAKAKRDQFLARVSELDVAAKAWQEIVNERRKAEAELAVQKAREALKDAAYANPAVTKLAQENARLAELRTGPQGLAARIEESSKRQDQVSKLLTKVRENFKSIKDRIRATGFTNAIGILLRVKRAEIPNVSEFRRSMNRRKNNISFVQLQLIELDEKMSALANMDLSISSAISEVNKNTPEEQLNLIKTNIKDTLTTRKGLIESLISDYNAYFVRMVDVDSLERQLVSEISTYTSFIDERILWVQSCQPLRYYDLPRATKAIGSLASSGMAKNLGTLILNNVKANPVSTVLLLIAVIAVFMADRRLTSNLRQIAEEVSRATSDNFYLTVQATISTLVHSFLWPLVIIAILYVIGGSQDASEQIKAVISSLNSLLGFIAISCGIRSIFLPKGLAEVHFKWKPLEINNFLKNRLFLIIITCGPLYFIFKTIESLPRDSSIESLERLVFMAGSIVLAILLGSTFRPSGFFFRNVEDYDSSNWIFRLRYVIFLLAGIIPACLVIMSGLGYFYTSVQILGRTVQTLILLFCIQLLYAFSYRALNIVKRSMAIRKAQERKARLEAQKTIDQTDSAAGEKHPGSISGQTTSDQSRTAGENTVSSLTPVADNEPNIYTMGKQTRKLFLGAAMICTFVGLWFIWKDVMPALKAFNRITLWTTSMKITEGFSASDGTTESRVVDRIVSITLSDIILAITVIFLTITGSRNLPGFLEFSILRRLTFDNGVKFAIRTISSYLITVAGFVIAFHLIGISWDKVQWLVAAVSVGLGFGLQEIFANFVSGLIILFERPMRVGDIVTVGDISGTVARIQIRATTITDWDRKEVIIPNKEFITARLVNWTLTDTILRVIFKVGVAYGSDTDLVQKLLLSVASGSPKVLNDPPTKAVFMGFGESSLDFELRVFIPNMDGWADFLHSINKGIDNAFRANDVEIPFPQRDLHLRVSDGNLKVQIAGQA
jgi:potassium efflux system protein